uniref:paralemmin-2-like isoform X1 n=1 Tax=Solea senegalensis TaxID=28829 RepID=UPI001CD8BBD5|nr:paralemmin-2-like isoform X1 [Solea senegalensis]XP_043906808.1 paralemmin-2-like isoform X1 [Solea senegalensis]
MQSMEEMDEAEKYQRRLRVITERLQQQEEEEKLRRETEEEWLKKAQTKRKYLRDQWLSETTRPPVLLPLDSFRTGPLPQEEEDTQASAEQENSQKTPEDEKEETADSRKKEQASQEERKELVSCVATARTHNSYQATTDEDARVLFTVTTKAEEHIQTQMEKQMFLDGGQDGRSVLGMVAVQVERDPKTGATVVRSVAPVSTPGGTERAHAVFDDGRMSIHAVGGPDGQPSNEELGQILNVIDGVGMKALLDEVTVVPSKAEMKTEIVEASRTPGEKRSLSGHHAVTEEIMQLDSSRSYVVEAELSTDDSAATVGNQKDKKDDRNVSAVTVDDIEDQKLEDGPVTLLFLGYTDATVDQGNSQDGSEGMITVERVMITDDGEEYVLGDETSAPAPPTVSKVAEQEAGKESKDEVFQEVPLDGNGAQVKVQDDTCGQEKSQKSSSPDKAEEQGKGTTKRKTCQCCSVM